MLYKKHEDPNKAAHVDAQTHTFRRVESYLNIVFRFISDWQPNSG